MKIAELNDFIKINTEGRFEIENSLESVNIFSSLENNLSQKNVFLIRRIKHFLNNSISTVKTLLIVEIQNKEEIKFASDWAAIVKDALYNPETADIYLFIVWDDKCPLSLNECLRIEADDEFCRKFVLHPDENIESFIGRTFISKIDTSVPIDLGHDPLLTAFYEVHRQFDWFNDTEQSKWKEAFNKGITSSELFHALI